MSLENIPNTPPSPAAVNHEEDLQAAQELIMENEVLKNNPRVLALLQNDFILEDGSVIDAGNFLAAMLAFLDTQGDGKVDAEKLTSAIEEALVIHSEPTR